MSEHEFELTRDWTRFVADNPGHETWIHKNGHCLQLRGGDWHLSSFMDVEISGSLGAVLKVFATLDQRL